MDELISRQAVLEGLASIAKAKAKSDAQKSMMGRTMFFVEQLPSVNPQANNEDIHREREQAYMRGYEDASKKYRTEPCEDAISRQDAEALFRYERRILKPSDYKSAIEFHTRDLMLLNAEQFIHLLPPVTPAEKTGRWIDDEFGSKCSFCGIHTHLDKFDRPMKFKHCSMCGAKMFEPQESEVQNANSN